MVQEQTFVILVIFKCLVPIYRQGRELGDQPDALLEHIGNAQIVGIRIIGIQRQHTPCQCIHHIVTGGFHDDIPGECGGQGTGFYQQLLELLEGIFGGQLPKQQQVYGFFKAKPVFLTEALDDLFHVNAPVVQFAPCRHAFPVYNGGGADVADIGQTRTHTLSVDVTQTPFYIVLLIKRRVDVVIFSQRFTSWLIFVSRSMD